ncbi:MAG: carbohydrate-binding family 9-like protein [Planctomycetes bacterium]|nr:carbohydrate-binding family 9-like protein [Planctomycetota bacterium]
MIAIRSTLAVLVCACACSCGGVGLAQSVATRPGPERYVCPRTPVPPVLDGRLDDAAWATAPWTADFVDIEGDVRPRPPLRTRAKLAWDDNALYVAAELTEPHVWGTLTRRDSVIFQDDDFEVFIDPDGDTHDYYELEINALGTEWDLLLVKPYRDGGPAVHGWDIAGLRSAVRVDGTLNDPSDTDRGWSVEIALPWPALAEAAGRPCPPSPGDVWRLNFSRVDWTMDVSDDGTYRKRLRPDSDRPLPESNWVWSPQGVVDMHRPETWGLVLFAAGEVGEWPGDLDAEQAARAALRAVYRAQADRLQRGDGSFAADVGQLGLAVPDGLEPWSWPPRSWTTPSSYEVVLTHPEGRTMHLTGDGRIWIEVPPR